MPAPIDEDDGAVGRREPARLGGLGQQSGYGARVGFHRRELIGEVAPFDQFHAEIAATIAFADFVNGNDKWMVEAGGGFCFAAKAL